MTLPIRFPQISFTSPAFPPAGRFFLLGSLAAATLAGMRPAEAIVVRILLAQPLALGRYVRSLHADIDLELLVG